LWVLVLKLVLRAKGTAVVQALLVWVVRLWVLVLKLVLRAMGTAVVQALVVWVVRLWVLVMELVLRAVRTAVLQELVSVVQASVVWVPHALRTATVVQELAAIGSVAACVIRVIAGGRRGMSCLARCR
jgi:hypothetical protein